MELAVAERMARFLMRKHGLTGEWKFAFDRAVLRFGSCQWRRKKITLSAHLTELNDESRQHFDFRCRSPGLLQKTQDNQTHDPFELVPTCTHLMQPAENRLSCQCTHLRSPQPCVKPRGRSSSYIRIVMVTPRACLQLCW